MFDAIKNLFTPVDYSELMKRKAIIIDVRSRGEFQSGHIEGSINCPVDELEKHLSKLKDKDQPIITCCASGMRSGMAKRTLVAKGYKEVYNGGGWSGLNGKVK
ncbi:MAG TPA: rhodanese-like domain-containing protein [Fulvivirga sp.]|nr:rhodanese-like domain-containing protein [Fulvivirga sp.]